MVRSRAGFSGRWHPHKVFGNQDFHITHGEHDMVEKHRSSGVGAASPVLKVLAGDRLLKPRSGETDGTAEPTYVASSTSWHQRQTGQRQYGTRRAVVIWSAEDQWNTSSS
jgi:hypothetical protein